MPPIIVNIRPATLADLEAINHVIEAAVMTWTLPERVKRLSLPTYRYTALDFHYYKIVVAEDDKQNVIGISAWEQANTKDSPAGHTALLLHGIYVHPAYHHQGVGQELFKAAEQAVHRNHCDGLIVKAQENAIGFFISQGMIRLQTDDPQRHYANRFWKIISK
jgi:predicted N-acetyltransferase YhbS